MAQETAKKRRKDRARASFLLLMLSVVLVFGFGLIVGKQNMNQLQQVEAVPQQESEPEEAPPVTENTPAEAVPVENVPETTPEFHQATGFWSVEPHVYLRVNHTKALNLACNPDVNLSEAIYGVSDEGIALVDEHGLITGVSRGECTVSVFCGTETLRIPVTVRELVVENGCTYVDGILVANKSISLPEDYDPGMLPETAEAFAELQEAAKEEDLNIYQGSGYRDYQYQITCYNSLVNAYGEEYADKISAKPGHSEHQTGYTVDCNSINETFINTPEGQWLDQHAHEFGFIIRYPEGKEDITGYSYECWHIRYVGVKAATEMFEQGLTLEEYLDIVSIENDIPPLETESDSEEMSGQTDEIFIQNSEMLPEESFQENQIPEEDTDVPFVPEADEDEIEIIDAPLEAP
ncbi:MAG: M15 family metallopeptidase [Oscillospiraceae bacterium]|nr:M15 family metallopeptidase [Oscillospiraceae bacterium]